MSSYMLVSETPQEAQLPQEFSERAGYQNGRLTLLANGQESNEVIRKMIRHGFILRGMYEQ